MRLFALLRAVSSSFTPVKPRVVPANHLDCPQAPSDDQHEKGRSLDILKVLLDFAPIEELLREVHERQLEEIEWLLIETRQVVAFQIVRTLWLQVDEAGVQWLDVD